MLRKVRIEYGGSINGNFEYISNVPDLYLAISVATTQMFRKSIWLDPKTTTIRDVLVERVQDGPNDRADEVHDGSYGEGGL